MKGGGVWAVFVVVGVGSQQHVSSFSLHVLCLRTTVSLLTLTWLTFRKIHTDVVHSLNPTGENHSGDEGLREKKLQNHKNLPDVSVNRLTEETERETLVFVKVGEQKRS